ncbi:dTMP kinase [Longirhabdus pacifica]|uniref:dTMP kinase n=1 Tax=Longirhabdus pacifica TaxID=2305227 RepID=UPI001008B625|nr:dTMP kinase [Longirhabdus pacifica]
MTKNTQGIFITIEGGEGAGKTTILQLLEKELANKGIPYTFTREPGGIRIAEKIRDIILNKEHTEMDGKTEALLYAAARRQHLVERILPEIQKGTLILCDRFIDSSLAYQGIARGIGLEAILDINIFAIEDCFPHLTLYLDIEPEEGLKRIGSNKNREINRLDIEHITFHHKVREGYLQLLERYPNRIKKIDASSTPEHVMQQCLQYIMETVNE